MNQSIIKSIDDSSLSSRSSLELHNIDSEDNLELLKRKGITDTLSMSTKLSRERASLPTQAKAVPYLLK
jgi:hypothetical protein